MKNKRVQFVVVTVLLNLGFIACGGDMKKIISDISPLSKRVVNLAHRVTAQTVLGSGRSGVTQLAFFQVAAPVVTQSFEGRCSNVPNIQTDFTMEGAGRFNDNTNCANNFFFPAIEGAPVAADGVLTSLYCFGKGGLNSESGKVRVQVIPSGQTTPVEAGLSCKVGTGRVDKDITHTFTVHAGDQVVLIATSQNGETLTRLSALVGE